MHPGDSRLAPTLRRQHGLVTRSQATEAGCSSDRIEHLIRSGRWEAVASGVYRLAGTATTFRQRAMVASLAAGSGAAVSHWSAAVLLQVGRPSWENMSIHVSIPRSQRGQRARSTGAVVHQSRLLSSRDRVNIDAIPVTRPARLLVDMAAVLASHNGGLAELEDLVDDVLFRYRQVSATTVLRALDEVRPRTGGPALRRALQPWTEGHRPGSPPEIRLQRRLAEGGVRQAPVRQFEIFDPVDGSFVARPDLAFPDARIAIEYLGQRWHGPRRSVEDEKRRRRMLDVGWEQLDAYEEDTRPGTCRAFVEFVGRRLTPRSDGTHLGTSTNALADDPR